MTPAPKKPERLFLLDGMALAYRAYFSFITRPLLNSKGENTSAIFGFVNTLMKILKDDKPDHIAVVFDTKEPTFRHLLYDQYKATRQKMPEDMSSQMGKLKEVVLAFNVPLIELPGYEADDIMGTLARRAEKEKIDTYLVTGDKDFMQLVSDRIKIYKPGKQGEAWETLDETAVKTKFGVTPELVIDVLGLTGDKSDNVPGIPGIGEKTAIPLVQQYGTIENILRITESIPQKGLRQKLEEHQDKALLSKKLVTIDIHVPLEIDLHHLNAKAWNAPKLKELFLELEFKTLFQRVAMSETEAETVSSDVKAPELSNITLQKHNYHLVATAADFERLVKLLKKSKLFVFDTETTSKDPLRAELVGISFAISAGEAWYVPVIDTHLQLADESVRRTMSNELRAGNGEWQATDGAQEGNGRDTHDLFSDQKLTKGNPDMPERRTELPGAADRNPQGLPLSVVFSSLGSVFSDPSIKKVGQNLKYDILVLASHGVKVEGAAFDTMIANYVLRPNGAHNMDAMAEEHLQYKTISFDDLTGAGKERKDIRDVELEKICTYSCEDADVTFRLYELLKEKLEQQSLMKLCADIEFPLLSVLAEMEFAGIALDVGYLANLSKELERDLQNLTADIYRLADEKFNINSTQQLSKILFEKLKLATVRKTKTGFSTDVGVLEALRHEHPIIEKMLDYRQMQKLKSTYVDALPVLINPRTGRLHTSFNQTIAATGRLSSSDPNLQNIPIRTELGSSIRKAFIPEKKGSLIISADYSQIELRIMAHISGDEGLKSAFVNGEDIHATTAAKVFGVPLAEITRDMRRKAKEVNFGIMYGIGPFGLASRLEISQSEAKEIITTYFSRFPKVNQYIADTIAQARQDGYVSTLYGRRRFLPDVNSRNFNVRSNAERQAINMPIQGTAADMIKLAMIRIHDRLEKEEMKTKMLLQVHDELVFEAPQRESRKAAKIIMKEMKDALPLSVPVDAEVGLGKNWLEAH